MHPTSGLKLNIFYLYFYHANLFELIEFLNDSGILQPALKLVRT